MATHTYRHVNFGAGPVEVTADRDGVLRVRSNTPLGMFPDRVIDSLFKHAAVVPTRDGAWQCVSYAQAAAAARSIGSSAAGTGPLGRASGRYPVGQFATARAHRAWLHVRGCALRTGFAGLFLVDRSFGKLRHIPSLLTPGMVFADDGTRFSHALTDAVPQDVEVVADTSLPAVRSATPLSELLATAPGEAIERARTVTGPDTVVKFLCTSGSTKTPKAVINTNRMWASNRAMESAVWPFLAEEPLVLVDWLPWHHTFGGNQNFGLTLLHGGSLYIDDGKPTSDGIAQTLANLREISPTVYFNVPKGWEEITHALEQDGALRASFYRRLRMQFYAGAVLDQAVWDRDEYQPRYDGDCAIRVDRDRNGTGSRTDRCAAAGYGAEARARR
jgi:feruloyl-CoA synthase